MEITFRWFGSDDAVSLAYIRQIPAVTGIVSALYDVSVGEIWPFEKIEALKGAVEREGLKLTVIESIPVHEDIKLGRGSRDRLIDNYCESIVNLGRLNIPILCYNFMPVFDWTRSNLSMKNSDGSTSLSYTHADLEKVDLTQGTRDLPGWAARYSREELAALIDAYSAVDEAVLWDNLACFLERVVPVAEESGVRMGIHPDDPPWPIFGLPRIITGEQGMEKLVNIIDSPSNGITFCTGSLGPNSDLNMVSVLDRFVKKDRVPFVHMRNIKRTGERDFYESGHLTDCGDVDMYGVMASLVENNFIGAVRPDHGRMIWGETGRPGYGLYDRALGAMYLAGLREGIEKSL